MRNEEKIMEKWNISETISWKSVEITGGFWKKREDTNRMVTLPAEYEQCRVSGRVDSVKCIYHPENDNRPRKGVFTIDGVLEDNMAQGGVPRPHHYWDSDLAKWIEGAAYSLYHHPDPETEEKIDSIVEDFAKLQMEDGYLNTYYTVVEPGKRWTNVYQMHELYCAGHLIEAAVAYYEATGKDRFLKIICKYADYIDTVFGPEEGKIHGYPGHQEIELSLVKLYRLTKESRYLRLAKYFLDERGKQPYFFEEEAKKYGRDVEDRGPKGILGKSFIAKGPYALFQSHLPVREQDTAEGHAVRVTYMACAMADVAAETRDESLWTACSRLWDNVTTKRMYVTGGIGSQDGCERFNFDYQLPNEEAYNETCASIGLVMWANRMLMVSPDGKYGDIMERALYNGVISGVSLKGDKFFYANHLAVHPGVFEDRIITNPRMFPVRQSWFPVSCCPMNLARLTESIGGYVYSRGLSPDEKDIIYVHLYLENSMKLEVQGQEVRITQKTRYPWDGKISIFVETDLEEEFTIAVRIPGWCHHATAKAGEETLNTQQIEKGYLYIRKNWNKAKKLELDLQLRPFLLESHPSVRMNCAKAAIQYGPLVYCLEEADNGKGLFDIMLNGNCSLNAEFDETLLGGVCVVTADGFRRKQESWRGQLYLPVQEGVEPVRIRAVPYYSWSNRESGEMTVWIGYQYGNFKSETCVDERKAEENESSCI